MTSCVFTVSTGLYVKQFTDESVMASSPRVIFLQSFPVLSGDIW